ncbi:Gp15 family bacteriophage protein [Alkalibacillus almallahensis]|uniref:Gp15 family bacteriophage protein n=1 Tax=Alkalibacillus almallahensis TaxID=1379154 RepID=UPI00142079E5|nr:Gp15 family bacteriophage protein [Alkalibacillus almallahensis]NIK12876.1 hypothetical protein [Alkalibacillus almallahensis]
MRLTERFQDVLWIDANEYQLDLSFDNILRIHELKDDLEIDDKTRIELMFQMLVGSDLDLTLEQKVETIEYIFSEFVTKEKVQEKADTEDSSEETEQNKPKSYDLNKDADYIFASFFMDYGIDLIEKQGALHWRKFIALLNGLSEKTPFMQVIKIRTMEVPKANKHNQEERKRIKKLKRIYALERDEEDGNQVFDDMVNAFGGRPEGGE